MGENRRLERFGLELPAKIEIRKRSTKETEIMNLFTGNVCAGGAFFHTDKPLPVGTQVKIDLILPLEKLKKIKGKNACIKVDGKVLRSDENGMAVRFNKRYKIIPL